MKSDIAFVDYVEQILIPDLKESGRDATVDDLARLVGIIRFKTNIIRFKNEQILNLVDQVRSKDATPNNNK
jgi:hypothetical protein